MGAPMHASYLEKHKRALPLSMSFVCLSFPVRSDLVLLCIRFCFYLEWMRMSLI